MLKSSLQIEDYFQWCSVFGKKTKLLLEQLHSFQQKALGRNSGAFSSIRSYIQHYGNMPGSLGSAEDNQTRSAAVPAERIPSLAVDNVLLEEIMLLLDMEILDGFSFSNSKQARMVRELLLQTWSQLLALLQACDQVKLVRGGSKGFQRDSAISSGDNRGILSKGGISIVLDNLHLFYKMIPRILIR